MSNDAAHAEYDSPTRMWAMLCHLTALAGLLVPLGNIWGPLIVWVLKRDGSPFVDMQGKESLNFQLSMTIYMVIAAILIIAVIGIILLPILIVIDVIQVIIASGKANQGLAYRYPLTFRFL